MCVAAIAWDVHPRFLLVAAGNRDEFHARPTAPLERWRDGSGILAGRDLAAGGTWLGVSEQGRFALLTNFRDPESFVADRPSRGRLVQQLLLGEEPQGLAGMNPFNLFHADAEGGWLLTNSGGITRQRVSTGVHGLSNGPLGRPWPKTRQLCRALGRWVEAGSTDAETLLSDLRKQLPAPTPAPIGAMPEHGPQPAYAPVFINNAEYGTRCSTVVMIGRDGRGRIIERSFSPHGEATHECDLAFAWPPPSARAT